MNKVINFFKKIFSISSNANLKDKEELAELEKENNNDK